MSDRVDYSIEGVKKSVESMRESNAQNKKNKQAFLEYIDGNLAVEWNTKEGQVAVNELRNFVNGRFQEYVDYLDSKIDVVDYDVVPALIKIDNA